MPEGVVRRCKWWESTTCESTTYEGLQTMIRMVPCWGRRPEQGTTFFGEATIRGTNLWGGYIDPLLGPIYQTSWHLMGAGPERAAAASHGGLASERVLGEAKKPVPPMEREGSFARVHL